MLQNSKENTYARIFTKHFWAAASGQFLFFVFFQRALFNFIAKVFFVKQMQSSGGVLQKTYVLNILQNASENLCIGVFSFSKVAK